MIRHVTRNVRRRCFHCEALEDRSLLSAVAGLATADVQPLKAKTVTEVIQGTMTGSFRYSVAGVVTFSCSGDLSKVGEASGSGHYSVALNSKTLKSKDTNGTATFIVSTGNWISVKFTGSGKESKGELVHSFTGTITGGSGQFAGATGSFSASSTAPVAYSGTFSMTLKLTAKVKS